MGNKTLRLLIVGILAFVFLAGSKIHSRADSLDEIERDIDELTKTVDKMERELTTLGRTISSPKGGTLILTLESNKPLKEPLKLEILLNGEEEAVVTVTPSREKNSAAGKEIYKAYLIPGSYKLTVRGRAGGEELPKVGPLTIAVEREEVVRLYLVPSVNKKTGRYQISIKSR